MYKTRPWIAGEGLDQTPEFSMLKECFDQLYLYMESIKGKRVFSQVINKCKAVVERQFESFSIIGW